MGIECCLSSRFSSVHCADAFSGGSVTDLKRRRPWPAKEGSHAFFSIYRSIGVCVSVSPHCILSHDDDQQHFPPNRLQDAQPGIANIGCHGLGILPTAFEIDPNNGHPSSHSPIHLSSAEWEVSKVDSPSTRGAVADVGVPLSLRMLKKKQQGYGSVPFAEGLTDVGNSMDKAFASIIFILKELHIESISIWQELFKQDVRSLLNQVHEDMDASFLWLFQQVFSRTPELMMLLMVLLANFTASSVAITLSKVTTPVAPTLAVVSALFGSLDDSILSKSDRSKHLYETTSPCVGDDNDWLLDHVGSGGGGNCKACVAVGDGNGNFSESSKTSNSVNGALHSVDDSLFFEFSSMERESGHTKEWPARQTKPPSDVQTLSDDATRQDFSSMASAFADKEKKLSIRSSDALSGSCIIRSNQDVQAVSRSQSAEHSNHASLPGHVLPSFVAPITASIEDDNYTCYDKTDLDYQYAISTGETNSMLLANYAQFLFLVRKDHNRAEELFRRALQCDPPDGNALSKFANFLWLARHNIAAAGKAYQAAVRAEPCNSFHAADYAYLLWSSGQ